MAEVYNQLPSLREADVLFVNRGETFRAAAAILARFDFEFGLCLVHAHCKLEEGEIMLARGNVTQPEQEITLSEQVYPERWLATGQAYEYTTRPTRPPPPKLFEELSHIAGSTGVLGLYHIAHHGVDSSTRMVERTQGRQNILEVKQADSSKSDAREVDAAWDMRNADPAHSSCTPTTVCVEDDGHHVGTMDFHLGYDGIMLEYAEGRKNVVRPYVASDQIRGSTQLKTAWDFAQPEPAAFVCSVMMICDWGYDEDDNLQHLGTLLSLSANTSLSHAL